ncbi:EVE domain-containing protein [Egbenema bharatensis]|uniref:EVE domain-containing protein n=1 Tax=Egbenema bharatensis TaxID=3463334 RepID=UPI003A84F948
MSYWLMKSEPAVYSITDLATDQETIWDGVRNYQARNFLREMQPGDRAFFYHSNTHPPGIAGLMEVSQANIDDPTQFDAKSKYYDPKSPPENPRWQTVKVKFVQEFATPIALDVLKATFSPEELWVVKRGNRLSVMPVADGVAEKLLAMGQAQE